MIVIGNGKVEAENHWVDQWDNLNKINDLGHDEADRSALI